MCFVEGGLSKNILVSGFSSIYQKNQQSRWGLSIFTQKCIEGPSVILNLWGLQSIDSILLHTENITKLGSIVSWRTNGGDTPRMLKYFRATGAPATGHTPATPISQHLHTYIFH
jgi:hypothetical protein